MRFEPAILRELTVRLELSGYLRIIPRAHQATPLGVGHGKSRFSSPDENFKVLYGSHDLPTALVERIIRDRFQGRQKRMIAPEELGNFAVAAISTHTPLRLVDLRTSGANRLGVPTDAVRGRAQQAGRKFGQKLHDSTDLDGIVYMSRITNAECIAVAETCKEESFRPNPTGGEVRQSEQSALSPVSQQVVLRSDRHRPSVTSDVDDDAD